MQDKETSAKPHSQFPHLPNWPISWRHKGFNDCVVVAAEALRYLCVNEVPTGGEQVYNSLHLEQIAHELDLTRRDLLAPASPLISSQLALQEAIAHEGAEAVSFNEMLEILIAVVSYLGIDMMKARTESSKPSDVIIKHIEAYAQARRDAAFAMLDRDPRVRQAVSQAWSVWHQSKSEALGTNAEASSVSAEKSDKAARASSEEGFLAGVAWTLEKIKDVEDPTRKHGRSAR